ncbi:hypothetical protein [Plantactinospora soyae]|uniref:Uncharacterized protein n=1 Tax=Plantactinospora soyae TaxID=1544732 RepID=A0A927M0C6_9ACTN|nr:hypothetical protein [Plantactinospora soyae]MBE1484437.1 hypothetical protein [Plantactinospora soyae]
MRPRLLASVTATIRTAAITATGGAGKNSTVRRVLGALVILPLVAVALAVAQPAQAEPGFTTTPPEGCHLYHYVHQGFTYASETYCVRTGGLHRAAARCADGRVVYGWTEEMAYFLMSKAECRSGGGWDGGTPIPAVEIWGEFWLDW